MSSVMRTRATSKHTVAETASALIKKRKLEGKPTGEASEPLDETSHQSPIPENEAPATDSATPIPSLSPAKEAISSSSHQTQLVTETLSVPSPNLSFFFAEVASTIKRRWGVFSATGGNSLLPLGRTSVPRRSPGTLLLIPDEDASWEPLEWLQQTFPQLCLEDEPGLAEGENVTILNLFTESRTLLTELWKKQVSNLLTALFAALFAS
uniref:Orf208 n=1 Tax=Batis maritima TaxID=4436 RepID=A0A068BFD2_BATMA|nr:orf208 [Batis maritima]AIC83409.1 orf208 [Batis maritima]